jgi:DNA-binding response OmpR family regulator
MNILVVEDSRTQAQDLASLLRHAGHEAVVAGTAAAAESVLNAGEFDAAVVDLELPDASGGEALARVRGCAGCATMPLVAVSALPEKDLTSAAARYSAVPLRKWFGLAALLAALDEAGAGREVP